MIQKPQVLRAGRCASPAALGTGEVPGTRGQVAGPGALLGPAPAAGGGVAGKQRERERCPRTASTAPERKVKAALKSQEGGGTRPLG